MPSLIGHSLAGVCGYIVARPHVDSKIRKQVMFGAIALANLADVDFLPGIALGNLSAMHREGTHSLAGVLIAGMLVGLVARRWKLNETTAMLWGASVYFSHILLDILAADPVEPFGVPLMWPLASSHVIAPVTLFAGFDFSNRPAEFLQTLFMTQNCEKAFGEFALLGPVVGLAWWVSKVRRESCIGH